MATEELCQYCDEPGRTYIKVGANAKFDKIGPQFQGTYTEILCDAHREGRKEQERIMTEDLNTLPCGCKPFIPCKAHNCIR